MILNYFKRFNHIHLRPLIQTLSIANRSIIIRSECYFSLDRKVTKRSRLHLLRYSASCVRCRLWTRYAQTAQPPDALYGYFALRSPDEAFHRTLCVLLGLPIPIISQIRQISRNTDKQVQPPTVTDNGGLRLSAGAYLYDVILQERVKQIQ